MVVSSKKKRGKQRKAAKQQAAEYEEQSVILQNAINQVLSSNDEAGRQTLTNFLLGHAFPVGGPTSNNNSAVGSHVASTIPQLNNDTSNNLTLLVSLGDNNATELCASTRCDILLGESGILKYVLNFLKKCEDETLDGVRVLNV